MFTAKVNLCPALRPLTSTLAITPSGGGLADTRSFSAILLERWPWRSAQDRLSSDRRLPAVGGHRRGPRNPCARRAAARPRGAGPNLARPKHVQGLSPAAIRRRHPPPPLRPLERSGHL